MDAVSICLIQNSRDSYGTQDNFNGHEQFIIATQFWPVKRKSYQGDNNSVLAIFPHSHLFSLLKHVNNGHYCKVQLSQLFYLIVF